MPEEGSRGWELPPGCLAPTQPEPHGPQSQLQSWANFVWIKPGLKCTEKETPLLWVGDTVESPAGGPDSCLRLHGTAPCLLWAAQSEAAGLLMLTPYQLFRPLGRSTERFLILATRQHHLQLLPIPVTGGRRDKLPVIRDFYWAAQGESHLSRSRPAPPDRIF